MAKVTSKDEAVDIIPSGQALSVVAGWLGLSHTEAQAEVGPTQGDAFTKRPQGLGLGAKFLPHHQGVSTATGAVLKRKLDQQQQQAARASGSNVIQGGSWHGKAMVGSKLGLSQGPAKRQHLHHGSAKASQQPSNTKGLGSGQVVGNTEDSDDDDEDEEERGRASRFSKKKGPVASSTGGQVVKGQEEQAGEEGKGGPQGEQQDQHVSMAQRMREQLLQLDSLNQSKAGGKKKKNKNKTGQQSNGAQA